MRTILLVAFLVLAAGASRAGDLSTTFSPLALDAQARSAARTAEARSLQTTFERLLSELGVRPHAAPVPAARPAAVLAALSGPPRVPGTSAPGRS